MYPPCKYWLAPKVPHTYKKSSASAERFIEILVQQFFFATKTKIVYTKTILVWQMVCRPSNIIDTLLCKHRWQTDIDVTLMVMIMTSVCGRVNDIRHISWTAALHCQPREPGFQYGVAASNLQHARSTLLQFSRLYKWVPAIDSGGHLCAQCIRTVNVVWLNFQNV